MPSPKNSYVLNLLEKLRNKACCIHTQYQANGLFRELRQSNLDEQDYIALSTAHSHYELGEGPEEFYNLINEIKEKYK